MKFCYTEWQLAIIVNDWLCNVLILVCVCVCTSFDVIFRIAAQFARRFNNNSVEFYLLDTIQCWRRISNWNGIDQWALVPIYALNVNVFLFTLSKCTEWILRYKTIIFIFVQWVSNRNDVIFFLRIRVVFVCVWDIFVSFCFVSCYFFLLFFVGILFVLYVRVCIFIRFFPFWKR